jgi:hypothetical protein
LQREQALYGTQKYKDVIRPAVKTTVIFLATNRNLGYYQNISPYAASSV